MQIVIDVDDKTYSTLFPKELTEMSSKKTLYWLLKLHSAVCKGTILPKGHGRLVDADMVMFENCVQHDNLSIYDEADCDMDCKSCDWLELYPKDIFAHVVIPADKEVDE